jgi:hypothetical protein
MSSDLALDVIEPVHFVRRPFPLPPTLHPLWGVSVLSLAVLTGSPNRKSSRTRLQVLYWALRSRENSRSLYRYLIGEAPRISVAVRYDPSFDYALRLAVSEGLLALAGGTTVRDGRRAPIFMQIISQDPDLLTPERQILALLWKPLSEKAVSNLFELSPHR